MLKTANIITILRIILIAPFVYCMWHSNMAEFGEQYRYYAAGIFTLMAISDALDGFVARKWNQVSKLGTFLDPMADKILMTCSCILLAASGSAVSGYKLPFTIVAIIIGKDLVLSMGYLAFLWICGRVKIVPNTLGKSCTVFQLAMIGSILLAPEVSKFIFFWLLIVKLLWTLSAMTAFFATLVYIRNGSRYIEELEEL